MTPPVFALYVTGLLLVRMADLTALEPSSSSSLRFVSVNVGDQVTLECFYSNNTVAVMFFWYKQILGQNPKQVSKFYKHDKVGTLKDEFSKDPRFELEAKSGINHLKISDLRTSDSATYYCVSYSYTLEFLESIVVIVKGSGMNIQAVAHRSSSETVQPGGSVTLSCTVHTGTCDDEHSVYWFRNSEESQPELIYTHGDRNDQCERKPDTQTHTCVYNLPLGNLNLSHTGTYYCAVASCGHILFGNGTEVDFKDEVDSHVLVYFLTGALAVTTILVVLLAHTAYRMYETNSCQCTGGLNYYSLHPTLNQDLQPPQLQVQKVTKMQTASIMLL
ncbi:uncharacterized protein LOC121177237 isoform X2 [Toxotes jaculatrix]|uniref:uncharacterized protein LOC121177237 isoform X2 n=1 Tax=Toxotes jaculatrix TaxID=941984 RepID=UPI001B3A829C|nr:uncharacterized protein LOC121177237 isoform X2 [Toxotes jaculatrix]